MEFFQFIVFDNYFDKIDVMGRWRMVVCLRGHLDMAVGGWILTKISQILHFLIKIFNWTASGGN